MQIVLPMQFSTARIILYVHKIKQLFLIYEPVDVVWGGSIAQSVHTSVYCPDTPGSILSATGNGLCQGATMSTQHKMSTGLTGSKERRGKYSLSSRVL